MGNTIGIGIIGLGNRGTCLLNELLRIDGIKITAVCDIYEDRIQRAVDTVNSSAGTTPKTFTDYRELIACDEVEAVVIATSWLNHLSAAIDCMKAGKPVGCEVGGAATIDECFALVHTYEETGTPIMLLENCCYGRDELLVLNMVKKGLFGDVIHCKGGYQHDLRNEIAFGKENRHYRLEQYLYRNCENYPTHELGPIAKVLDINRGNRFLSLQSVTSRSAGLHEYVKEHKSDDAELMNARFAQGDIVTTIIKCARGETITLCLDTTLPRYYSRGFEVHGTKAIYTEDNRSIFVDCPEDESHCFHWQSQWGNAEKYMAENEHPIWVKYGKEAAASGHDGMDRLVLNAFAYSIINNVGFPIDVYDMASWMCITALSEDSISLGGAAVAVPDFTGGKWASRRPAHDTPYMV